MEPQPHRRFPWRWPKRRTTPIPPETHYQRGNQLFEANALPQAAVEWRRAGRLWQRQTSGHTGAWVALGAALAFLLTVYGFYALLFHVYQRSPMEMFLMNSGGQAPNWWEEWLDTGRPLPEDSHKMDIREWWYRLSQQVNQGQEAQNAKGQPGVRTPVDKRWAELLQRYGRWGRISSGEFDISVVAGNGLSQMGDYPGAVAVLEKAASQSRSPSRRSEIYQALANSHYFVGYHLGPEGLATYDLKQVALAAQAYEKSIEAQPRIISYGNLGWMYFLLGQHRKAEENSLRALALDPTLEYVRLNLGLTYMVQDRLEQAYAQYVQVAHRLPTADVYLGGITDLQEVARDRGQRHPFVYFLMGFMAIHQGNPLLARQSLTRYISAPGAKEPWKEKARRWRDNPSLAMEE